jgi:hypothetical protein
MEGKRSKMTDLIQTPFDTRTLRLDEAVEVIPFLVKTYGNDRGRYNYKFLDTSELSRREDINKINAEPLSRNEPQIVGQFFAVRKPNEDLLEVCKIGSHEAGFFYQALDILFNHKGFLCGWGKLKSELEHSSNYQLKNPKQLRLESQGNVVSSRDSSYFIDDQSRGVYAKNRGWDGKDKRLEDIGVDLPISKNWTLGTFALLPRTLYTATISEASPEQQIVIRYSGEPLETALIRNYVKPTNVGNGIITMSADRIPLYLQRVLGLADSRRKEAR